MSVIITSSELVEEYVLNRCIELTGNVRLELFPHTDRRGHPQLAVIDGDTRDILFSSNFRQRQGTAISWTRGITFVAAYGNWCDERGYDPF